MRHYRAIHRSFSHAAMLGVGYMIGKSYRFGYKVYQSPNDPDASEVLLRVERKEGGYPMFWVNPWWNHHYHHCYHPSHHHQKNGTETQVNTEIKTNPELLKGTMSCHGC
ncbi:Protein CBG12813 [Caenorhabditis briggsae]|uniref:Protein CBG12813 n=1 Tax=Caenorhabditis briggsae TaxID=6238 RepID=A8XFN8_CAEBR|nr:Protein CBG12813 [Caenorhabditis briggsae]CAP31734.1 Protein CBG12813 [Caenorhabditis briggsae]